MLQKLDDVRLMARAGMTFQAWAVNDLLDEIDRLVARGGELEAALSASSRQCQSLRQELKQARDAADRAAFDLGRAAHRLRRAEEERDELLRRPARG